MLNDQPLLGRYPYFGEQDVHKNAVNFCKIFSNGKLKAYDIKRLEEDKI